MVYKKVLTIVFLETDLSAHPYQEEDLCIQPRCLLACKSRLVSTATAATVDFNFVVGVDLLSLISVSSIIICCSSCIKLHLQWRWWRYACCELHVQSLDWYETICIMFDKTLCLPTDELCCALHTAFRSSCLLYCSVLPASPPPSLFSSSS